MNPIYERAIRAAARDAKYGATQCLFNHKNTLAQNISGSTIVDSSGNGNSGALVQSNCGKLDGVDDYISLPVSLTGATSYKIQLYFKCTNVGFIFDNRDSFSVGVGLYQSAGKIIYNHAGGTTITDATYNDNEWHLLTAEWSGTVAKLTVDGASKSFNPTSALSITANSVLGKSTYLTSGPNFSFYSGEMCGVRIEKNGVILAIYPISEGSGTNIYDASGNGNHATAVNIDQAAFWVTQDIYNRNLTKGFRLSSGVKIPAIESGASAADGGSITNPASNGHNGAETKVNFNYGSLPTAWAHGDAIPSGMTADINGGVYRNFRYVA